MSPWVNGVVLALFGVVLGTMLSIYNILTEYNRGIERKPGESFFAWFIRTRREEQQRVQEEPRAAAVTSVVVFVLAAILVLAILTSPLEMNWVVFLVSFFVGFWLLQGVVSLARRGRLGRYTTLVDRIFPRHPTKGLAT